MGKSSHSSIYSSDSPNEAAAVFQLLYQEVPFLNVLPSNQKNRKDFSHSMSATILKVLSIKKSV